MITGKTRVFALLGDPVDHSVSPAMHNAAFALLGLPAVYVPIRCGPDDLPSLIRALVRAGGGGNVTTPHKRCAAAAMERMSPDATLLDAVNTFWGEGDSVTGANTDVEGIELALGRLERPDGGWLVAGTGGVARAVALAACRAGAALAIRSRSPERGAAFAAWVRELGVALVGPEECRILINATPLGLRPDDPAPIPDGAAPRAEVALDLVYCRGETPWVRRQRSAGLRAADGREVLLGQGAAAFQRWFPGRAAPLDAMRAAVRAALR